MEKLNEKQMARAFDAFWAATGRPGGEAERQATSVAFAEMDLTPYLAGELVSAALSGALGGHDVAGQLQAWNLEWAPRLQAQHDADLARRPPADCGPTVPFK